MARPTITVPGYTVDGQPLTAKASLWSCLTPQYENKAGFMSFTLSAPFVAFQVWGKTSLTWQEYQEGLAAAKVLAGDLQYSEEFGCPASWIPFIVKLSLTDIPEYIDRKPFDTVGWDTTNNGFKLNVTATSRADVGANKILAIDDSGVRDFHDYDTFMSSQSSGSGATEHKLLSSTHADTVPDSAETGALIVGKGVKWTKLQPPPSNKYVLAVREGSIGWWPIRTTKHLEEGKPWPRLRTINGIPNDGPRYYGYNSKGEGPGFWKWSDVDCQEPSGPPPDDGGGDGVPQPTPGTPSTCDCQANYWQKHGLAYPILSRQSGCTVLTGARAFYLIEPNQDVDINNIELLCPYVAPTGSVGIPDFTYGDANVTVNKIVFGSGGEIGIDVTLSLIEPIGAGVDRQGVVFATIYFYLCSDCQSTPSGIGAYCVLTAYSDMEIRTCTDGTDPNNVPQPQVPDWFPQDIPIDQVPPDQPPGFGPGGGPGGGGQPFGGEGDGIPGGGNDDGGGFPGWGNQNPCEIVVPPGGRIPPNLTGKGLKTIVVEKTVKLTLPKPTAISTFVFKPNGNPNDIKVGVFSNYTMGDLVADKNLLTAADGDFVLHPDNYDLNGRDYLANLGIANSTPDTGIPDRLSYLRFDGAKRTLLQPNHDDYRPKLSDLEAGAKLIFKHEFDIDRLTPFVLPAISLDCRILDKPIIVKLRVPSGAGTYLHKLGYIIKNFGFLAVYVIDNGMRISVPMGCNTQWALAKRGAKHAVPILTKYRLWGFHGGVTYTEQTHGAHNYWCMTSINEVDTDIENEPVFDDSVELEKKYTFDTPVRTGAAFSEFVASTCTMASSTSFDLLTLSFISRGIDMGAAVEPHLLNIAHHSHDVHTHYVYPFRVKKLEVYMYWLTTKGDFGSLAPMVYRNGNNLTKISSMEDNNIYNWNVLNRIPSMIGLVWVNLFSRRRGDIRDVYYNNDPMFQDWYPSRLCFHANATNPADAMLPVQNFSVDGGFPDWKMEIKIRMRAVVT